MEISVRNIVKFFLTIVLIFIVTGENQESLLVSLHSETIFC